jgi:subtilisin family serine protease
VAAWADVLYKAGGQPPVVETWGRVPVTFRLPPNVAANSVDMLEVAPGVAVRWVHPSELSKTIAQFSGWHPWVSPPLTPLMDRSGARWTMATKAHELGATGQNVVIGIIDTGLDVAHPDLRDSKGNTRVAWMLDLARQPLGKHPELEDAFGCTSFTQPPCAVLSADDIDEEIQEDSINRSTDVIGHGTHVASIAAGNDAVFTGVAPEASLVAVRVTRSSAAAITDSDILNAVRFVFNRAEKMGVPAVVNVSLGGDFGPHDGTSPLEAGMAAFVGATHPGRAIVVASGNSGGVYSYKGELWGAHTEVHVAGGGEFQVPMRALLDTDTIKGSAFIWITSSQGDNLQVGLSANDKEIVPLQAWGEQAATNTDLGGSVYAAVINGVVGESSPIQPGSNSAVVVIDGTWKVNNGVSIVLKGEGTAQLWVQGTGDAEAGVRGTGWLFAKATKHGTVTVPASHPDLLAVGCTLNRTDWIDRSGAKQQIAALGALVDPPGDSSCYFSSAGPNALGTPKPELSAPGAFVVAAMSAAADPNSSLSSMFLANTGENCASILDCNVVDDKHAVGSGTSMATPQVTGAVALLLQRDPSLSQPEITALLQAGARKFEGIVPLEYQSGPGALNVVGALNALQERGQPRGLVPDPAQSWLHVSTAMARPDGKTPVVGTLQLRALDGGIADGFDSSLLKLAISNANVKSNFVRKAPGLYEFSLVALPGAGGKTMKMEVRYNNQLLGARQLPIATDIWNAQEPASARGGCSWAPASFGESRQKGAPWVTMCSLLAVGWMVRRKQGLRNC